MNELHLDFYGVQFSISSIDSQALPVLDWLRSDFEFFVRDGSNFKNPHRIILYFRDGEGIAHSITKTRMCQYSGWLGPRVCDYGDGTVAVLETSAGVHEFLIYSKDIDHLFEVAMVALLSASGEALDEKGFHRVHAAGFTYRGSSTLLLLPEGHGKSTLSLMLMKFPDVEFFSDESPLLKGGVVYPFPMRFAVRPEVANYIGLRDAAQRVFKRKNFPHKVLFPIATERVGKPMAVDRVLIGRGDRNASIEKVGKLSMVDGLFKNMVVGLGIAQMREFMIRADNGTSLFKIASSRLHEAFEVSRRADAFRFSVVRDPNVNFKTLTEFLVSQY